MAGTSPATTMRRVLRYFWWCVMNVPMSYPTTASCSVLNSLSRRRKAIVERVAGAAHGADRILFAAGIE
jgi:hypothetical protein